MPWAQANLKNVRQEVLRRLYGEEEVLIGTASGGSTTTLIDIGSTDGVHLESGMLTAQAYIGAYVYVPAIAAPKWSRVTVYDPGAGQFTLSPALGATPASQEYEIHFKIHPERLDTIIKNVARIGTRQAIDTIAEGTAINVDYLLLAEGALAQCKRILAKRFPAGDANRVALEDEAAQHEAVWQDGLVTYGYGPSWAAPYANPDEAQSAQ